jgi:hypothetical protein
MLVIFQEVFFVGSRGPQYLPAMKRRMLDRYLELIGGGSPMPRCTLLIAALVMSICAMPANAQTETAKLLADANPDIQTEIRKVWDAMQSPGSEVEFAAQIVSLRNSVDDRDELVRQLAIFFATTEGAPETHSLLALMILSRLELPDRVPIRVLAPCLDSENEQLRDLAEAWFEYHDGSTLRGRPPFGSSNYDDYRDYVRNKYSKNEEVPAAFVEYIYETDPGKALLVFAYSEGASEATKSFQQMAQVFQAARQNRNRTPEVNPELRNLQEQNKRRSKQTRAQRDEIILAEHIVANAIWLNENGFAARFQWALPEANVELAKLSNHDKWWARRYVAEIMRRHGELRQADIIRRLSEDTNSQVSKRAKSISAK